MFLPFIKGYRALQARDERYRVPSRIPWMLCVGVWMVATLMVSATFPGGILIGYLYGVVSGVPLFFPFYSYLRRSVTAEIYIGEWLRSRRHGGPRQLAQHRRRVAASFGLDHPALQPIMQKLVVVLKWFLPVSLALGSVLGLLISAHPDSSEGPVGGLGATMTAAFSGVGATFAFLFWRRMDRIPHDMPHPTEAEINDALGQNAMPSDKRAMLDS